MRVAIVGSGALGATFGVLLQEANCDVTLIDIDKNKVARINNYGITLHMPDGSYKHQWVKATTEPEKLEKFDIVQISVKGYATEAAAKTAAKIINGNSYVLSVQNGLGNLETIAKIVGKERVVGGVTAHSAMPLDDCHIRYTGGIGGVWLGTLDGRKPDTTFKKMIDFLNQAGFTVKLIEGNIEVPIWRKLIANVACNAVAGFTGFTGEKILECEPAKELIKLLAEETAMVARKKGLEFEELKSPGEFSLKALAGVKDNKISMLQDIEAERRTEIDTLNGYIVKIGKQLKVKTPYNHAVTLIIKALEQKILWNKQARGTRNR
ncbi:MAG: 2-dehydropantoate 2-reductase [Epsilonproteobacteria bacterium]|nr:2-dehydropantoate 2-reductase [Campylobacterota bacterium]